MQINFVKYQGTGNDFILVDNRLKATHLTTEQIHFLCNRKFGIGADGLMLIELEPGVDFKMVYYNSDGNESSMCGNGGRCITAFAKHLGIIDSKATFIAIDGLHDVIIEGDDYVHLKMKDVKDIEINEDSFYLNTGSPHYVVPVNDLANYNVFNNGKNIRYNERFVTEGTNVNFIEKIDDALFVRTYERGVEDETLSCGTGVTAAAICASLIGISTSKNSCIIKTLGGDLEVTFEKVLDKNFYNIWLKGKATKVFNGSITISD